MIMLQSEKVIFLVTSLLVNGFIISCDASRGKRAEKDSLIQDEKDQLIQAEEGLIEKLENQVKPVKREGFEKAIKEHKGNKQEIEKLIKGCADALQTASKLEKEEQVSAEDNGLKFLQHGLEIVEGINRTIVNDIPLLKQFFTDLLELYQNFQKQVELNE